MLRSLSYMGFRRFPLTFTGVPELEKSSRPIGFEKELAQLMDVVEKLLNSRLNENLLVVIVGEYGWGKTELLDFFVNVVTEKYNGKVEVARVPLTFNLSSQHIVNIIRRRSGKPLILIIDEADEIVRALSLRRVAGDGKDVERVLTELSSTIRALLEPRQYAGVIGLPLEKLRNMMIVLSVTPQVYYGILKSYVPDIFDVSVGRIFREIVLRSETPLWLYDAIVQEKLRSASTPARIREIEKGRLDPLHPLRFEYLAALYYILERNERRMPSPRTLLKYTAKLLDLSLKHGKLDIDTFIRFLREISNEIPVVKEILSRLEEIEREHEDTEVAKVRQLLEIVPIPLTEGFIIEQTRASRGTLETLLTVGDVEKVKIVKISLSNKNIIKEINNIRARNGLEILDIDERELSLKIDDYYTRYENEPIIYIAATCREVLRIAEKRGLRTIDAYILKRRRVLEQESEGSSVDEIRKIIRKTLTEITNPLKFVEKLTEISFGRPRICGKIRDNVYFCYTSTGGLGLRALTILIEVDNMTELNTARNIVDEIIREGSLKYNNEEIYYDIISIVIYSPKSEIDLDTAEKLGRGPWKIDSIDRSVLTLIHVVDSSNIEKYRSSIIGLELVNSLKNIPEKYNHYLKYLNELREKTDSFLKRCSDYILKNLVIGVRRGRGSKSEILREIVEAWIRGEKILDQPEIWRDANGRARISNVEWLLYQYLKSRVSTKITIRELERLIRKLFPTFLWKDFREKDLVEICKLRGLIIEVDHGKYLPYTPSTAKSALARKLEELKRIEKDSRRVVEIKLGKQRVKLQVQLTSSETLSSISRIRQTITEIADLREDEESLKKFAKVMMNLEDIESDMRKEIQHSENILKRFEETSKQIDNEYNRIITYIENIGKYLPKTARKMLEELESEVESTIKILSNYDIINAEELYEYIRRIGEKMSILELEYGKVRDLIERIVEICNKALDFEKEIVEEVNKNLRKIDLRSYRENMLSIEKTLKELEKLYNNVNSRISSRLAKINREIESLRRVTRMLCTAGLVEPEICSIDLEVVENVKKIRPRIVERLREIVNDVDQLLKIAEIGDEVSADMLDDKSRNVLEKLCEMGLVKKVYRFVM